MASIDDVDVYNSNPHNLAISCNKFSYVEIDYIVRLIEVCISTHVFQFENTFYLQKNKDLQSVSPILANIVMDIIESSILAN